MSRLVISFRYKEEFFKELHQIFLTGFFEKFPFRVYVTNLPGKFENPIFDKYVTYLYLGTAWKTLGLFTNEESFRKSVYTPEEIFHPTTLVTLRNKSMFNFQEQYSSYYGLCFTMQNLKRQKVSDYSFQFVVNRSIDYTYYLHEPLENEWLFMSAYPYEIVIKYLDTHNNNEIYGISLVIQKQIIRKIPGKGIII